jgi:hypothetical protein
MASPVQTLDDSGATCARCGREPRDDAEFEHAWLLIHDQDADWPYCPECIEAEATAGRVPVADAEVGVVWGPAPRGEG